MTRTAHCSCGALRVEVYADPDAVGVCHCGECHRRTGSVFSVSAFFKKEHVRAEGTAFAEVLAFPFARESLVPPDIRCRILDADLANSAAKVGCRAGFIE